MTPASKRVADVLRIGVHAEHQDPASRRAAEDVDRGVQAVDFRHPEIEHDDIRLERAIELDGLRPAIGFADDDDVRFVFEDAAEALAHERVVVGEQDADGRSRHHTSEECAASGRGGSDR